MELIPDFIDRKKGKKKVEYLHPLLEEVSKETHGILIYQEQVQKKDLSIELLLLTREILEMEDLLKR